jgi:hypothetical protein
VPHWSFTKNYGIVNIPTVLLPSQTSSEKFKISGGGGGMMVITRKLGKMCLMGIAEI